MTDYPGGRRNPPADPTDEAVSDPVPTGDDVVNRHRRGHDTPRRYEEPEEVSGSGVPDPGSGRRPPARPVVRDLGSE
jgi:hypothetical protein